MGFLDLFKGQADKDLATAFGAPSQSFQKADTVRIGQALDAGANPNAQLEWVNTLEGSTWWVPALVATTLQRRDQVHLDVDIADLLLSAGADPHKTWKGRKLGLGWSFALWVYATGSSEGWNLLKKHEVDLGPLFSKMPRYEAAITHLPKHFGSVEDTRNEMRHWANAIKDAEVLRQKTAEITQTRKSPRL